MVNDKIFFMHETQPRDLHTYKLSKEDLNRIRYLRKIILKLGKNYPNKKTGIKIPIQAVFRQPIRNASDFSHIKPGDTPPSFKARRGKKISRPKGYFKKPILKPKGLDSLRKTKKPPMVKIPQISKRDKIVPSTEISILDFKKPKDKKGISPVKIYIPSQDTKQIPIEKKEIANIEKKLPLLPNKLEVKKDVKPSPEIYKQIQEEVDVSRVVKKGERFVYIPLEKVKFKKYGIIDRLIADKRVNKISAMNNELFVDYENKKNLPTGLRFKNQKELNSVIKNLAKQSNLKINEENPILDTTLPEGFRVHANYGTDYISGNFTLIRV